MRLCAVSVVISQTLRFGMEFVELKDAFTGKGNFSVFDEAKYIGGICVPGCADYSRKQLERVDRLR